MRTPKKLALALASLGLAAAGCGGSDSDNGGQGQGGLAQQEANVQIVAPEDGSSSPAERITVRGTVSPSNATVQILGRNAQVGNGVFAGSVALHNGENTIDVVASAPGVAPATATVVVTRKGAAAAQPKPPKASASGQVQVTRAPPIAGATNCGAGLSAGARTSCPFAENVRTAFEASGSGVLDVYSPTTRQTYRMYCTAGSPHVCTGGNGASVFFWSGPTVSYSVSGCSSGVTVGPNTSCGFALNVRESYYRNGAGWHSVFSPTTGRSYTMYCTATSPHVCTGGNNAAVYFP
jgi:hypothetical protein